MLIAEPWAVNTMPSGTPERDTDTEVAPGADTLIVADRGTPALPCTAAAVMARSAPAVPAGGAFPPETGPPASPPRRSRAATAKPILPAPGLVPPPPPVGLLA